MASLPGVNRVLIYWIELPFYKKGPLELLIVLTFVPIQIHYSLTTELLKSLTSTHFSLEYVCINLCPIIYPNLFRICLCLIHKSILIKLDIQMIFIPCVHSSKSINCVSFQGAMYWNSLNDNLKKCKSPYMFKKKLTNFLLEKYHDWFVLINILFYVSLLFYWYNYCQ